MRRIRLLMKGLGQYSACSGLGLKGARRTQNAPIESPRSSAGTPARSGGIRPFLELAGGLSELLGYAQVKGR